MEVRAVVSYDEKTVADTKAQSEREYATQKSIKNATWAAFMAVSIYALLTSLQWCEMRQTTKTTQDQLVLLRDADRPWVAVDVSISSPLTFDSTGVHIEFAFVPN